MNKLFHRHDWNLIDKTIVRPAADSDRPEWKIEHVVHVFKCACGEVKVVNN